MYVVNNYVYLFNDVVVFLYGIDDILDTDNNDCNDSDFDKFTNFCFFSQIIYIVNNVLS